MKRLMTLASAGAATLFAPLVALAQDATDYSYDYDYNYNSGISDAAAAGLGIGMMIVFVIAMLIGLAFFIFWIMMLVDAVKRQWPERGMWLAILIVGFFLGLSWLAALLYYFMVKRKNVGSMTPPAAPMTPPSAPAGK